MLTIFQKSDAEVAEQVIQELRWDCRTETSPIRVAVSEGVVTLSGRVKYYAVKQAAEEAAHRIAGVAAVRNDLEVKALPGEYRADMEIAGAIRNAFAWNVLVPAEQIEAGVKKGIVTLSGTVNCLAERDEAERALVNLLGVRGIVNELAVRAQFVEAERVYDGIKSTLERQAVLDTPEVKVDVEQGAVRLSGRVPSWNQRCAVVAAAGFAHGVHQVIDDLKVSVNVRTA